MGLKVGKKRVKKRTGTEEKFDRARPGVKARQNGDWTDE
jgi:hypothetical protein